jgi:hypothetical protein
MGNSYTASEMGFHRSEPKSKDIDEQYTKITTVKELITMLLDQDMSDEVIIIDKDRKLVREVTIAVRHNPRVIGALFG